MQIASWQKSTFKHNYEGYCCRNVEWRDCCRTVMLWMTLSEKSVGKLVARDFERRKFSSATFTRSALESYATWKHFVENSVFSAIFHLMLSSENIFIISTSAMLQVEHGLPVIKSNQREGMTSSKQFLLCTRNAATFAKNPSTILRSRYLSEN